MQLVKGWKEDPETLILVKDRARSDVHQDVRKAALEQLVNGWKEDPETLTLVKESVPASILLPSQISAMLSRSSVLRCRSSRSFHGESSWLKLMNTVAIRAIYRCPPASQRITTPTTETQKPPPCLHSTVKYTHRAIG